MKSNMGDISSGFHHSKEIDNIYDHFQHVQERYLMLKVNIKQKIIPILNILCVSNIICEEALF